MQNGLDTRTARTGSSLRFLPFLTFALLRPERKVKTVCSSVPADPLPASVWQGRVGTLPDRSSRCVSCQNPARLPLGTLFGWLVSPACASVAAPRRAGEGWASDEGICPCGEDACRTKGSH